MSQSSFDASSDPNRNPENVNPRLQSEARVASQRGDQEVVSTPTAKDGKVPFLGIHFKCCSTYGRIYRNRERHVYEGRCPKCRRLLTVPIGPGGLDTRFLSAQ